MAITYVISGAVTSTSSAGVLQLWTGLDLDSAAWIVDNGFNFQKMREYCSTSKELWTTVDLKNACNYAHLSVAVNMHSGVPAVLGFRVAENIVDGLMSQRIPLAGQVVEDSAYWFMPDSFSLLNAERTDVSVHLVSDISFEE